MTFRSGPGLAAGILSLLLTTAPAAAQPMVALESSTTLATAGYYQLHWDAVPDGARLVESKSAEFVAREVVYAGADTAHLVSGKPDGDYYYRLESASTRAAQPGVAVSNTLRVRVQHHPLERALLFFGIGAAVFAATLGLVVFGSRSRANRT